MKDIKIGRIIKHGIGYGFKITFEETSDAERCKDMIYWILKNEKGFKVNIKYNRSENKHV